MRKILQFLFLAVTLLSVFHYDSDAQSKKKAEYRNPANDPISKLPESKKLSWAELLYKVGSYSTAIDYYSQLKQNDERNPYYTYMLADCYKATRDYVPAAHYYAEVYTYDKKDWALAGFFAGQMYKQQGEYHTAIDWFNKFLDDNKKTSAAGGANTGTENYGRNVPPKVMKDYKKRAKMEIEGCTMAMNSIKDPQPVTIINCGPNVNSAYTELSPLPLGDTGLLFSSMQTNNVIESDLRKITPKEQFWTSRKQPGYVDSFQWALPFNDGGFNIPSVHTGNGCYSPGGDKFYFTRCEEGDSFKILCKIFVSKFGRTNWEEPVEVPAVNEPGSSNTMPFSAKVGKKEVLFFSSNRKQQSRGGYDIWYSIVDPRNGTYRRPQNCGKQINTTSDEITPYYDSRVNKLYFASNGLRSFGGFDVYSADGGPTRYANVQNLGYPINTSADDLYFIKDPIGKPDAYIVSNRIGTIALSNPTCCNDIWRIQYEPRLVVMGRVLNKKTMEPMPQTVIKKTDQKGEMDTYNSEDGNFLFNMSRGHSYVLTSDKTGYTSSRATVSTMSVKRSDPDDTVQVTILLDTIKNPFHVSNIYYDYDSATLRSESIASLDTLVNFMKDNPSITVEIFSYTDGKGTPEYNLALSQRRAQAVMDYLEKFEVDRKRMKAVGMGDKDKVAQEIGEGGTDDANARQKNRRTEFRIISDTPNKRVIFNSAKPGSMDEQDKNLHIDVDESEDAPAGGKEKKDKDSE